MDDVHRKSDGNAILWWLCDGSKCYHHWFILLIYNGMGGLS